MDYPKKSFDTLAKFQAADKKNQVFQAKNLYATKVLYTQPNEKLCDTPVPLALFENIYDSPSHTFHYTGMGLYAVNWTMFGGFPGANPEMDTGVLSVPEFEQADLSFWEGTGRYGCGHNSPFPYSHYLPPRPAIIDLPFFTFFNTGIGEKFFYKGNVISTGPWSNFSIQSILPTWQDLKLNEKRPNATARFDYQTAYEGGSSWKIEDATSSKDTADFKLFKTALSIENPTQIRLFYKPSSNETIRLILNNQVRIAPIKVTRGNALWQEAVFSVSPMKLNEIDISVTPNNEGKIEVFLGSFKIIDLSKPSPAPISQTVPNSGDKTIPWTSKDYASSYRIHGVTKEGYVILLNEVINNVYDLRGNIFNGMDKSAFQYYKIQEINKAGEIAP